MVFSLSLSSFTANIWYLFKLLSQYTTWRMLKRLGDNKVITFNITAFWMNWLIFGQKNNHIFGLMVKFLWCMNTLDKQNRQKEAEKLSRTASYIPLDRFQLDMFQFQNCWEDPCCSPMNISLLFIRTQAQTFKTSPQLSHERLTVTGKVRPNLSTYRPLCKLLFANAT